MNNLLVLTNVISLSDHAKKLLAVVVDFWKLRIFGGRILGFFEIAADELNDDKENGETDSANFIHHTKSSSK